MALRGSGRSRAMTRFSAPPTLITHTRTPAGLMSQIRAARYGASGLAAPQDSVSFVTPGVAREAYPSGTATNPASLRAVARSSTQRGFAVRQYLEREEAYRQQQQQDATEHAFESAQERVNQLLELGQTDAAADLVLRMLDMAETLGYSRRGGR